MRVIAFLNNLNIYMAYHSLEYQIDISNINLYFIYFYQIICSSIFYNEYIRYLQYVYTYFMTKINNKLYPEIFKR